MYLKCLSNGFRCDQIKWSMDQFAHIMSNIFIVWNILLNWFMFNDYANASGEKNKLIIWKLFDCKIVWLSLCSQIVIGHVCHCLAVHFFSLYPNEDVHSPKEEVSNATPLLFGYEVVKKKKWLHTTNKQSPLEYMVKQIWYRNKSQFAVCVSC